MKENELKICVWFHHIATIVGLILGCREFGHKTMGKGRKCALLLFLITQVWAVEKIISNVENENLRLRDCLDNIHKQSKNEYQARGILATLLSASVLFKIGTPLVLREKNKL